MAGTIRPSGQTASFFDIKIEKTQKVTTAADNGGRAAVVEKKWFLRFLNFDVKKGGRLSRRPNCSRRF
jgi:hypothetical protein